MEDAWYQHAIAVVAVAAVVLGVVVSNVSIIVAVVVVNVVASVVVVVVVVVDVAFVVKCLVFDQHGDVEIVTLRLLRSLFEPE